MGKRKVLFASAAVVAAGIGVGGIATAGGHNEKLNAQMRSTFEVPMIADTDGRGTARVTLDADAGEVCYDLDFSRIGTPDKAHIHTGVVGAFGPVLILLFDVNPLSGTPNDEISNDLERGHIKRCNENVDKGKIAQVMADPTGFYVNLHNARYPNGALRGQLH
jgi:CHRD domain